jgi:uncharacterized protein (TIGR02611 family)
VGEEETRGRRSPLIERVRARQQRHRERNRIFRAAFAVAGFLVLFTGVVMLVTPGPGIPVIILGLTMLALEFAWAERSLERIADRAERAVDQVRYGSPARRVAVLSIGGLAAAALITLTVLLWDIPLLPG